tara:strand:+ start:33 stop:1157 length:1125 start_codon:yes stop_codon:yes gene_type:complete
MSAEDMNYASAINEGSNMSRNVAEHNEGIRQNNQLLVQAWSGTIQNDKNQTKQDKYVHGGEDAYGAVTAVASIGDALSRVKKAGGFIKAVKADAQATADRFTKVTDYISKKVSGNPTEEAKAGSNPVSKPNKPVDPEAQAANPKPKATGEPEPTESVEPTTKPVTVEPAAASKPTTTEPAVEPAAKPTVEPTVEPASKPVEEPTVEPSDTSGTKSIVSDVADKEASNSEELSGTILGGVKNAAKVGRFVGVAGGVMQLGMGIHDIADGSFSQEDGAHKFGSILGDIGGALDVASVFIPVLAPFAAVANVASAIDSTVNDIADDKAKTGTDQGTEKNQVNENKNNMEISPAFASMSLIGSSQQSSTAAIAGSGSF